MAGIPKSLGQVQFLDIRKSFFKVFKKQIRGWDIKINRKISANKSLHNCRSCCLHMNLNGDEIRHFKFSIPSLLGINKNPKPKRKWDSNLTLGPLVIARDICDKSKHSIKGYKLWWVAQSLHTSCLNCVSGNLISGNCITVGPPVVARHNCDKSKHSVKGYKIWWVAKSLSKTLYTSCKNCVRENLISGNHANGRPL